MRVYFTILLMILTVAAMPSHATWYQGQASKVIGKRDFEEVRTETIKQAIANAALQGQSFIQAEDIVLDGLLQSSKTVLRSKGQIRRVEVIDEFVDQDVISVIVRADIEPLLACEKDIYAKSLLNTQFTILNPIQASVGALFDIGTQTTKRFEQQLNAQPNVQVNSTINQAVFTQKSAGLMNEAELDTLGNHLALQHGSQFILFGFIRDISLFEQVKDEVLYNDIQLRRNFTIQVFLYDAIRNSMIMQKSYHGEGNWNYPTNHLVDTNNSEFWRNDFGRAVLHTVNSAVTDINDVLACQQSYAHIVDNYDGKLVINIGQRQGVKIGDEFDLVKLLRLQGADGKTRILLTPEESSILSVVQVNKNSSVLSSELQNFEPDSNILNFVSPKTLF